MPRTNALAEADQLAAWVRVAAGRELRLARHNAGLTTRTAAARLGWSKSKVSRIERGLSPALTLADVAKFGAVVGLKPSLRFYPSGQPLRDAGQVELLAALNARMHPGWRSAQEVPMPIPRDLRAADQLSSIPGCRVMIEAYRWFGDSQAQTRSARTKQRDLGADRLILLIEDTRANRRALAALGDDVRRSFPISQRAAMAALAAGTDPGGDAIILLRRRPAAAPHG